MLSQWNFPVDGKSNDCRRDTHGCWPDWSGRSPPEIYRPCDSGSRHHHHGPVYPQSYC